VTGNVKAVLLALAGSATGAVVALAAWRWLDALGLVVVMAGAGAIFVTMVAGDR
jgi:hypothetical protein